MVCMDTFGTLAHNCGKAKKSPLLRKERAAGDPQRMFSG